MLILMLLAAAPGQDNAWDRWLEPLPPAVVLAEGLPRLRSVDSTNTWAELLDLARDVDPARADLMDVASKRLAAGLKGKTCTVPKDDGMAFRALRHLVELTAMRGFLAAAQDVDVTPWLLELLSVSRRVATCRGGGLRGFSLGKEIENLAAGLLRLASRQVWLSPSVRKTVNAAVLREQLNPETRLASLADEERALLLLLPPEGAEWAPLSSRAETAVLLKSRFDEVRRRLLSGEPLGDLRVSGQGLAYQEFTAGLRAAPSLTMGDLSTWLRNLASLPPEVRKPEEARSVLVDVLLPAASIPGDLLPALSDAGGPLPEPRTDRWCSRGKDNTFVLQPAALERLAARDLDLHVAGVNGGLRVLMDNPAPDSFAASCGLEPDDVVSTINELAMGAAKDSELEASIRVSRRASLKVLRRGKTISLQIAAPAR